jgi:hypothetical protein
MIRGLNIRQKNTNNTRDLCFYPEKASEFMNPPGRFSFFPVRATGLIDILHKPRMNPDKMLFNDIDVVPR